MADDNNVQVQPENTDAAAQQTQIPTIPQDVKDQMQASLAMWNGGEIPPTLAVQATPNDGNDNEQAAPTVTTTQTGQQQASPITTTTQTPEFSFDILKTKYGYQSPEDAYKEIEELRTSREKYNAPITDAEIEFENEFSEKLFTAIKSGKTKEVYQMLAAQERINELTSLEVTKDNAADVIKYGMSLRYKNLTPEQIDYKYNKQFKLPARPTQGDDLEDDYNAKLEEWKQQVHDIEMEKMIEAKMYLPELEKEKASLVLPDIPVDEDYLNYKKMIEEQSKSNEEVSNAYKTLTPKSLETKLNFKDEPNKIDFEFQFEPDGESFKKVIEALSIPNKLGEFFKKSDGTSDREEFARVIYFGLNRNNILTEAMKQSKNAAIKAMLPDNSQGGMVRQMAGTPQMSKLDEEMKKSLAIGGVGR